MEYIDGSKVTFRARERAHLVTDEITGELLYLGNGMGNPGAGENVGVPGADHTFVQLQPFASKPSLVDLYQAGSFPAPARSMDGNGRNKGDDEELTPPKIDVSQESTTPSASAATAPSSSSPNPHPMLTCRRATSQVQTPRQHGIRS